MNVQIKTSSGISLVPMDTRLMGERKIFIEENINNESALQIVKQLMYLNLESETEPIDLMINSMGGEINSGLLIYDAIASSKAPVRTYCIGRAYSMAAILFASGRHGRYMLPHSELMLHEPLLATPVGGNSSSILSISETLLKTKHTLTEILALHTGRSEKEIPDAISFDHYYSSEEAIEFGLCDGEANLCDIVGGKR